MSNPAPLVLSIPAQLRRGALRNDERASVDSALALLRLMDGVVPLAGARILDYGCGVKIVQGLHELGNPQARYAGVDVYAEMIAYLAKTVPPALYEFGALDFYNEMYNPNGKPMTGFERLPIQDGLFTLITMFSVVTHLNPPDALAAFRILRSYAAPGARLLFSAFISPVQTEGFVDAVPGKPLLWAYYRRDLLDSLLREAGWNIISCNDPIPDVIQHHYVCSPA